MNLKLKIIRDIMKTNNIDAYFITTSDYHQASILETSLKFENISQDLKGLLEI